MSLKAQLGTLRPQDEAQNGARVPETLRAALGLAEGDPVEITAPEGRASVCLRALPPYPEDEGIDVLRTSEVHRVRLGVEEGGTVRVSVPAASEATRVAVTIGGSEEPLSEGELREGLEGRNLVEGDVVALSHETEEGSFRAGLVLGGLRLLGVQGGRSRLIHWTVRVDGTTPAGVVTVTRRTSLARAQERRADVPVTGGEGGEE